MTLESSYENYPIEKADRLQFPFFIKIRRTLITARTFLKQRG